MRKPRSFNIEESLIKKIMIDAHNRSMENGNPVSRSDIVNRILNDYYNSHKEPHTLPDSKQDNVQATEHMSKDDGDGPYAHLLDDI